MGENSGVTLSHISEIDELESGKTASILVIAHIKAPLYVTDERRSRAPISVSAVLDRSGSMSGTKLELVKKTMEFVVQNFKEDDRLGVIAYDDDIAEPFPISYMTETDRKRAVSSVQAIQVGGSTNLSGGLFAGIDQIRLGRINVSDYSSRGNNASPMQQRRGYIASAPNPNPMIGVPNSAPVPVPSHSSSSSGPSVVQSIKSFFTRSFSSSSSAIQTQRNVPVHQQIVQTQTAQTTNIQQMADSDENLDQMLQTQIAPPPPPPLILQQSSNVDSSAVPPAPTSSTGISTSTPGVTSATAASAPSNASPDTAASSNAAPPPLPSTPSDASATSNSPTQETSTTGTASTAAEGTNASISSVWLFTDGLANEGIQDIPTLKAETQRRLAQMSTACSVFTFGFGGDHDANMLRGISESGNGMYYYIETEDKIPDAFADCLGGLISVAAQNLRLTVTPHCAYRIVKIQTAFKNDVDASTGVGSVQMPDIYSEEARDIIFEVEVPVYATPHAEARAALTFTLQYFNVLSCMQEEVSSVFELRRPETCSSEPKPMPVELDKQRNRILCMEALAQARSIGERDLSQAREILKSAIEKIERSVSAGDPYSQSLVSDLKECLDKMVDHRTYETCGHQLTSAYMGSHAMQRSCASRSGTYATSCKMAMNVQSKAFFK